MRGIPLEKQGLRKIKTRRAGGGVPTRLIVQNGFGPMSVKDIAEGTMIDRSRMRIGIAG